MVKLDDTQERAECERKESVLLSLPECETDSNRDVFNLSDYLDSNIDIMSLPECDAMEQNGLNLSDFWDQNLLDLGENQTNMDTPFPSDKQNKDSSDPSQDTQDICENIDDNDIFEGVKCFAEAFKRLYESETHDDSALQVSQSALNHP